MGCDETRWLEPRELDTWLAFASLRRAGAGGRARRPGASWPPAYYQVLAMLSDVPDRRLRMSELAAITQSSQSRLSHAVARLEREGWVRRTPCPADRRSTYAELTEAGFAALEAAAPGHVSTVRKFLFDRLTPEQVGQLHEISKAVLGGLGIDPDVTTMPAALAEAQRRRHP